MKWLEKMINSNFWKNSKNISIMELKWSGDGQQIKENLWAYLKSWKEAGN